MFAFLYFHCLYPKKTIKQYRFVMQTGVLKMFTMNIVCIIILLVLSTNYTQGELFTSISQLTSLVESHSQITQILQDYVDYHQNALDKASL